MRPALVFTLAMWFVVGLGKFMFIFSLLAIMGHGSAHQSADQLLLSVALDSWWQAIVPAGVAFIPFAVGSALSRHKQTTKMAVSLGIALGVTALMVNAWLAQPTHAGANGSPRSPDVVPWILYALIVASAFIMPLALGAKNR